MDPDVIWLLVIVGSTLVAALLTAAHFGIVDLPLPRL